MFHSLQARLRPALGFGVEFYRFFRHSGPAIERTIREQVTGSRMGDRVITEKQMPERRAKDRRKKSARRRNVLFSWTFDELRETSRRKVDRRSEDRNNDATEEADED